MNLPEGGDGTCRGPGTELCILGWSSGVWKEVESQLGREGGAECNGLKWTYSPRANLGHRARSSSSCSRRAIGSLEQRSALEK